MSNQMGKNVFLCTKQKNHTNKPIVVYYQIINNDKRILSQEMMLVEEIKLFVR